MRVLLSYLICSIIFTLSPSCTKIIDIDLPEHKEKIIVNSFFTSGKPLKVHLSKSISVLEDSIPLYDNALIKLLQDNTVIDTLYREGDYYLSNVKPEKAKHYTLIINAPGMDSIICSDMIPETVPIQSYRLTDSVMIAEDGFIIMQCELSFTDPPGKNYYEISMATKPTFFWLMKNTDPVLVSTSLLDYNPKTLIFNDNLFDGKATSIKVNYGVRDGLFQKIGNGPGYQYPLSVSFRSVSEPYFLYKQKQIVYLFSLESDILTGQPEPVQLYSNVEGGYGIFAGYSSDNKTINVVVQ